MKPRILIVDDEPRMAHAIATALERNGYECRTCGDGAEALATFRKVGADVESIDANRGDIGRTFEIS